jgi:hypothetical protein
MRQDFKDIKVGDKLLVDRSSYGERSFYTGTVTKVTATRFTVEAICFSQGSQVFTKDGFLYPRTTGYGRAYVTISFWDSASESKVLKHKLSVKARNLADKLNSLFANSNVRRRMTDLELDPAELNQSIEMLESVLKQFEKYTKETT